MPRLSIALAVPALLIPIAFGCSSSSEPPTGSASQAQLAPIGDRFKPLGPNKDGVHGDDDSLFTPADFEAAAASHPEQGSLVYFSRCRRAPFTSATFYSPITG